MNAPTQPVPPVSNPATFFASRVLPDQIAEALIEAREKCGVQKRRDEDGHAYFDAVDVVPEVGKVFRDVGLSLFAPNFQIRSVGTWLVLQRAGCLRHDKGSQFPITAEWLIDLGGLPPGPAMNAALTQSTSGLYRVCMDLVKDETKAKRDPELTGERPSKPAGKRHTARQIGALARANGLTPPEDVSEKDERESRDELARVEAEAKANADPRWKDEKPIADPPGLMEDEPAVAISFAPGALERAKAFSPEAARRAESPYQAMCDREDRIRGLRPITDAEARKEWAHVDPDPAMPPTPSVALKPAGGQWVVYEAETHIQKADSAGLSQPVDTATPSSAVLGGDLHRNGDTPQTRTEIPAPPVEGTSSSAGHSNDGPNFLDQGEWSGVKSESSAGGESLPPSSSSPPAPGPLACSTCGIAMPCGPYEHECAALVQPTPEQVALVASKASGVLAKRSAEGRAAPWTHAKLTKARKYFPCSVCQPDGVEIEVKAAIQFRAHYRDAGSGKRACLPCWERLESEAAGAGKAESAA